MNYYRNAEKYSDPTAGEALSAIVSEEKALRAPVTMMLPMVAFIFPVIFIVLMGPAAMNIMESLGA